MLCNGSSFKFFPSVFREVKIASSLIQSQKTGKNGNFYSLSTIISLLIWPVHKYTTHCTYLRPYLYIPTSCPSLPRISKTAWTSSWSSVTCLRVSSTVLATICLQNNQSQLQQKNKVHNSNNNSSTLRYTATPTAAHYGTRQHQQQYTTEHYSISTL